MHIITAIEVFVGDFKQNTLTKQEDQHNGSIPKIDPSELAEAIRFHRKKSGLSQVELAKLAGVGKTVIFDVEKNKQTIRLNTLLKILKALNIEVLFESPIMEIYLRTKDK